MRAAVLIGVHVLVLAHLAHWKLRGRTLSPLEPSEAMQTLELGYVNAGAVLLALTILATLVLGRFFCGWACHVVAYQDLCAWGLGKLGLRPSPVRSRLLVWVPVGAAFYMFVWPSLARALEGGAAPAFVAHFTTEDFWGTFPGPGIALLTFFVDGFLIVWLMGAKGFCTYGCPYGALFGLADRAAPGRIRVTDACKSCAQCTAVCTSNVRVHEEVARHGAVVDPGCMKCMDCVASCPEGALELGFGSPTGLFARARRSYDFSWREELVLALGFGLGLYAFRGLYELVPFLLALGLAVLFAVALVAAWRLVRLADFELQRHVLKAGGRWRPAGRVVHFGAAAFVLLALHSAFVQFHAREGVRFLVSASELRGHARAQAIDSSRAHLERVERFGLVSTGVLQLQLGSIDSAQGRSARAEERYRRATELDPDLRAPRLALADLLILRGAREDARRVLEELLELEPEHPGATQRLDRLGRAASGTLPALK